MRFSRPCAAHCWWGVYKDGGIRSEGSVIPPSEYQTYALCHRRLSPSTNQPHIKRTFLTMPAPATVPFIVFSLLASLFSPLPLFSAFELWNVGNVGFIFWVCTVCFSQYFNSVVWIGSIDDRAPGWCVISTGIVLSASFGIPASCLCASRRLWSIVNPDPKVEDSKDERSWRAFNDSVICFVLPIAFAIMNIANQAHKYKIVEDIGCAVDPVAGLFPLVFMYLPPLCFCISSILFSTSNLWVAYKHRASQVLDVPFSTHNNLTLDRFIRLSLLALLTPLLISGPLLIFGMVQNNALAAISAAALRLDGASGAIPQLPLTLWHIRFNTAAAAYMEFTRWSGPACALLLLLCVRLMGDKWESPLWENFCRRVPIVFWDTLAHMGYTRPLPPLLPQQHQQRGGRRPSSSSSFFAGCEEDLANDAFTSPPRRHARGRGHHDRFKMAISNPVRPASGTGSYIDLFEHTPAPLYPPPPRPAPAPAAPVAAPKPAAKFPFRRARTPRTTPSWLPPRIPEQGLSFVAVKPHATIPGRFEVVNRNDFGWHRVHNHELADKLVLGKDGVYHPRAAGLPGRRLV
ncbi:unnamed protein product [Mycena citricolor]|uniref:STE3-like pheromone receptor n=1 Tax=Mycena citricolor TaxID=2018698 RepID=A0AAD2H4T6_9AGAR|nr:unnamed protein product [Mycena citricolor]